MDLYPIIILNMLMEPNLYSRDPGRLNTSLTTQIDAFSDGKPKSMKFMVVFVNCKSIF